MLNTPGLKMWISPFVNWRVGGGVINSSALFNDPVYLDNSVVLFCLLSLYRRHVQLVFFHLFCHPPTSEPSCFIGDEFQAFSAFLCCACASICTCLYVEVSTQFMGRSNSPPPPDRQDSAIFLDQFPLNLDELLMPTFFFFFFLLMEKSLEMDFCCAPNEFVSCLRCQYYFQTLLGPREALIRILDMGTLLLWPWAWYLTQHAPMHIHWHHSPTHHQAPVLTQGTELQCVTW